MPYDRSRPLPSHQHRDGHEAPYSYGGVGQYARGGRRGHFPGSRDWHRSSSSHTERSGHFSLRSALEDLRNNLDRLSAKEITQRLHGSVKRADHQHVRETVSTDVINRILLRLETLAEREASSPNSIDIATFWYSAGLMAKNKQLSGIIDGTKANEWLNIIQKKSELNDQSIANTVYGIGRLAWGSNLSRGITSNTLNLLLSRICHPNAQAINNTIYGLGLLARAGRLTGSILPGHLNSLISRLLDKNSHPTAQEIANTIYGLGLLVHADRRIEGIQSEHIQSEHIQSEHIHSLLIKLLDKNCHPSAQHISNTIYGLALLARADILIENIGVDYIQDLVIKLLDKDVHANAQEIANAIYGLGLLARAGKLNVSIKAEHIHSLVIRLLDKNSHPNAQDIANTVYGLGLLAQKGKLSDVLTGGYFNNLVSKLLDKNYHPNAQDIANTIYGLGLLAQKGRLTGFIFSAPLTNLVSKLLDKNLYPTEQHIANTIYGLGLLAKKGRLTGSILTAPLNNLVSKLLEKNSHPDDMHISTTIYGFGLLARSDKLSGRVPAEPLAYLVNKLLNKKSCLKEQDNVNILYGLSLTARHFDFSDSQDCLLQGPMHTLLRSYTARHQKSEFTPALLLVLVQARVAQRNLYDLSDCRSLFIELIGLCMAQGPALSFVRSVKLLAVCTMLLEQQDSPSPPDCPLSGYLAQLYNRWHAANPACLTPNLQTLFNTYIEKARHLFPSSPDIDLQQRSFFADDEYFDSDSVDSLSLSNPEPRQDLTRLATRKRARITETGVAPGQGRQNREERVLKKHRAQTNRTQKSLLRKNPNAIKELSDELLTQARSRSLIFEYIHNKDMKSLQELLQLRDEHSHGRLAGENKLSFQISDGSHHRDQSDTGRAPPLRRDCSTVDVMVQAFFTGVNPHAMKALVCDREASWFLSLIRACSFAQRYRLAVDQHLYLVVMNLELSELEIFINTLIGDGVSIHVHHGAALALLNNLTERSALAQAGEVQGIRQLQARLLDVALEFHQRKKHRHVVGRLSSLLHLCQSNRYLTLGDTNDPEEGDECDLLDFPELEPPTRDKAPTRRQNVILDDDEDTLSDDIDTTSHTPAYQQAGSSSQLLFFGSPRSGTVTLGDGNCIYNTVAVGLIKTGNLAQFHHVWRQLNLNQPIDFIMPEHLSAENKQRLQRLLDTLDSDSGSSAFDDILQALYRYNPDDAQRVFAPLLRHLACICLLQKRQALAGRATIYSMDDATVEELFRLDEENEYMALAKIPFIREKVKGIIRTLNADGQAADQTRLFSEWWREAGEEQYIRHMAKSAANARQRELWGSEIELAALCECLNITVKYEHGDNRGLLGRIAGMYSKGKLVRLGCTEKELNLLEELGFVDRLSFFDADTSRWVTEGYRFNQKKAGELEQLGILPRFFKVSEKKEYELTPDIEPHDACEQTISYIVNYARNAGITHLKVMQREQMRFGDKTIGGLIQRNLLTGAGYFVTNGPDVDYPRILRRLCRLRETTIHMIKELLLPSSPLFTARLNHGHWEFQPGENTATQLDSHVRDDHCFPDYGRA
ncbi:hypothetical protein [Legionella sp. CNM-4043-24]|uniref:hypothetical protein n=1 Tax=Legionella sp. CNM-4043-24 TaxID=3421646 RepID=UPI00403B1C2B